MAAIAAHHGEVVVLRAGMKAQPQAEAVGQGDLLLDRLAGIDRGRALVVDHVARHQMAAVGGGVEQDIVRPALEPALQHGLERLVAGVAGIEAEVVAEQEAAARLPGQQLEQEGQAVDVLAVDLDQGEAAGRGQVDPALDRLDQRALAHAAGTPQQGIVGGQAAGEALGVGEQDVAHPVDADQQLERHRRDLGHGAQLAPARLPDEGVPGLQIDPGRRWRCQPLDRAHQPLQGCQQLLHAHGGRS